MGCAAHSSPLRATTALPTFSLGARWTYIRLMGSKRATLEVAPPTVGALAASSTALASARLSPSPGGERRKRSCTARRRTAFLSTRSTRTTALLAHGDHVAGRIARY